MAIPTPPRGEAHQRIIPRTASNVPELQSLLDDGYEIEKYSLNLFPILLLKYIYPKKQ